MAERDSLGAIWYENLRALSADLFPLRVLGLPCIPFLNQLLLIRSRILYDSQRVDMNVDGHLDVDRRSDGLRF